MVEFGSQQPSAANLTSEDVKENNFSKRQEKRFPFFPFRPEGVFLTSKKRDSGLHPEEVFGFVCLASILCGSFLVASARSV